MTKKKNQCGETCERAKLCAVCLGGITEQETVTVLPDGSAFGVMTYPLPQSHWLYAEREYRDGEDEPVELGKPILTRELRDFVVSAVRYAIRGATNCGKEMNFDPDALVQNAVYALCGPYTRHVDAVNMSQECVDETAKGEHEPLCFLKETSWSYEIAPWDDPSGGFPVYTTPPKRRWVDLTDEEIGALTVFDGLHHVETPLLADFIRAIEAKLKDRNV